MTKPGGHPRGHAWRVLLFAVGILLGAQVVVLTPGVPGQGGDPGTLPEQEMPAGPDVAVKAVRIVGPAPAWVQGEPRDTVVKVVVENRGSEPAPGFTIAYTWTNGTDPIPLNGASSNSTDASSEPLDPGENATHTAPWRLQREQRGNGSLVVEVTTTGDQRTSNNQRNLPLFLPVHALDASADSPSLALHPDETGFVRVNISNTGNVAEHVTLGLANETGHNRSRFDASFHPQTLELPPASTRTSDLFVRFPFRGEDTPASTNYTIVVNATSEIHLERRTPDIRTTFEPANTTFEMRLGGPEETVFTQPGEPIRIAFTVENTGNASDTYAVQVADRPPGWDVSIGRSTFGLFAGEQATIEVLARPGKQQTSGPAVDLILNVTSGHLVQPIERTVRLQLHGPAPRISSAQLSPSVSYTGQPATLRIHLENAGNQPSPANTILDVNVTRSDGSTRARTLQVEALPSGGNQTLQLDVELGSTAGQAHIGLTWRNETGQRVYDAVSIDRRVRDPAILVRAPEGLQGLPGEELRYTVPPFTFTIENRGNATESLAMRVAASAGTARIPGNQTTVLGPGARHHVAVLHTLPSGADGLENVTLWLDVRSVREPSLHWSAVLVSHVQPAGAARLSFEREPASRLEAPGPVTFEVCSDGEVEPGSMHLEHTLPNETSLLEPLASSGRACFSYEETFDTPGLHVLLIRGTGSSGVRLELGPVQVELSENTSSQGATTGPSNDTAPDDQGPGADGNGTGTSPNGPPNATPPGDAGVPLPGAGWLLAAMAGSAILLRVGSWRDGST